MSDHGTKKNSDSAREAIWNSLKLTRDNEIDCDEFLRLLAPYVDGRIETTELRALMEHHREICPECEEEREILARAILSDTDGS